MPNKVTAASACQYISPADQNNVANATNVNDADFFGVATWSLVSGFSQIDPPNDRIGTINLAGADFANKDYIIVFKDGADTNLVAFLLNETTTLIDWESPFRDPPFDFSNPNNNNNRIKDVSHYSVFERANVTTCPSTEPNCVPGPGPGPDPNNEVPAPASLALLGAGLAALGLRRARRA